MGVSDRAKPGGFGLMGPERGVADSRCVGIQHHLEGASRTNPGILEGMFGGTLPKRLLVNSDWLCCVPLVVKDDGSTAGTNGLSQGEIYDTEDEL